MLKLVLRVLIGALGLYLASELLDGIAINNLTTLLIAAVVLGIVNAIVRPVLFLLTLPLTILTLGLFLLVINAAMLGLTAYLLPGFSIDGFVSALIGSIIITVVSWLGDLVVGRGD
jgi:putative membrane protein